MELAFFAVIPQNVKEIGRSVSFPFSNLRTKNEFLFRFKFFERKTNSFFVFQICQRNTNSFFVFVFKSEVRKTNSFLHLGSFSHSATSGGRQGRRSGFKSGGGGRGTN